jgi:small-conductance mechanosensitive channel
MNVNPVEIIVQSVQAMIEGLLASLPQLVLALLVLLITPLVSRLIRSIVRRVMQRTKVRAALITLATNLISIGAWIVGGAIAIMIVFPSVTPAQFIAGLGIGSVAIGFAFKDVFENFLAGVIILGREKMQIGDVIECEGVLGRIENIWIRETHVRRLDGELVIVPNAFLFQNPLRIQTDHPMIRQELAVGVDYATDLPAARDVLLDALNSCESISGAHERAVQVTSFGASSIDFQILWWTESQPRSQRDSFNEVALAVKAALDRAKITIPFPQSTLSLRPEAVPLRIAEAARA